MARHIHLCWELGGGLGHAGRLKMLAQALLADGHHVTLSLRDLAHTHGVLADLPLPVMQAPAWLHRTVGLPDNPASLAEIALSYGYLEPNGLAGLVQGWRGLFSVLKPDVVVGDYAPTGLLAARSMGIPTASVGIGFTMPPPDRALPNLRDWEAIPQQRLAQAEARMLAVANEVLARHGAAPLAWAAQLFLGEMPLMTAWPAMDHYGRGEGEAEWIGPVFARGGGVAPRWPDGPGSAGPRVFAYLKSEHAEHAALLAALAQAGCRVLCYLPEVAGGKPPPVRAPGILYARRPVDLQAALADADWCVCHGGEATVAQAALAGVPLLLLPMQLEQFLLARRMSAAGLAVTVATSNPAATPATDWPALLQRLLPDPAPRRAAQAFATCHAGFNPAISATHCGVRLASLLLPRGVRHANLHP